GHAPLVFPRNADLIARPDTQPSCFRGNADLIARPCTAPQCFRGKRLIARAQQRACRPPPAGAVRELITARSPRVSAETPTSSRAQQRARRSPPGKLGRELIAVKRPRQASAARGTTLRQKAPRGGNASACCEARVGVRERRCARKAMEA